MATDYGVGISCISDWPLRFVFVSGLRKLGEDLCHRLQTVRRSMPWDLNCGWDVRALLRGSLTTTDVHAAQSAIGAECEKDPRVESATCTITFIAAAASLVIAIVVTAIDGQTFTLVLTADALTVTILRNA